MLYASLIVNMFASNYEKESEFGKTEIKKTLQNIYLPNISDKVLSSPHVKKIMTKNIQSGNVNIDSIETMKRLLKLYPEPENQTMIFFLHSIKKLFLMMLLIVYLNLKKTILLL